MDHVFLRLLVPFQPQYVWLATDLAVFYIGLRSSSRIVEGGLVPLSATGALETGTHRFGRTVTPFSPTIHLALTCVDVFQCAHAITLGFCIAQLLKRSCPAGCCCFPPRRRDTA